MAALIPGTRRRAALAALAVAALAATAGCSNPFAPTKPEPPDANAVVEDFTTPAKLLRTLEAAMANKGPAGRLAWADAMGDSTGPGTRAFYAFHDPLVVSAWRLSSSVPPPEPWDLELERRFYDHFVGRYQYDYAMVFDVDLTSPSDDIDDVAGTALLHRRYYVSADIPNQPTIIAIGYVDLYLVRYDGRWWIVRWDDRLDPLVGTDPGDQTSYTLGYRRLDSVSS